MATGVAFDIRARDGKARTGVISTPRGEIRTLALLDFPAHDLAAENIHDQIKVEEHARDRPWHSGDMVIPPESKGLHK